jgi:RNA polymerase sigma-70 factor (ECF subfamily)
MNIDSHSSTDAEVIYQVISGNVNAFERLLKKYEVHVMRIVKKHIPFDKVEEVAQDAFVRAYQSLANFKRDDSFKQWLSTITIRTCYDFWRKHYRYREVPVSSLSEKHQVWLEEATAARSSQSFDERDSQE